jgi:hypothetical protein
VNAEPVAAADNGATEVAPTAESPHYESPFASHDGGGTSAAGERPEIAVGAAFAGGLLLAMILKRFAP